MRFRRAARAVLTGQSCSIQILVAVVILAGLTLSCGTNEQSSPLPGPNHYAYMTLPSTGSVLQVQINGATGAITVIAQTPQVQGSSPLGLALTPSGKFLYAVNSRANTISIFNVGNNGNLTLSTAPVPAGNGPDAAVIDPSGQYLLVTNSFSNSISVYAIDSGSGALTEVNGSPFYANVSPTEMVMTHSGNFVYVTNPSIGMVTGFSFSGGVLTPTASPAYSGSGAAGLAVDPSDQFLYVANPAGTNPLVPTTGNVSGFNINSTSGLLTAISGSPFYPSAGSGPTSIAVDPTGRFVYAASSGSSLSVWCFTITSTTGQLVTQPGSPFSQAGGGLFALFDPTGNYFYMGSNTSKDGVEGYTYNSSTGVLTLVPGSPFPTGAPGKMVLSE